MKPDREAFHEQLTQAVALDDDARLTAILAQARAADIAESFELLDDDHRSRILFTLPAHTAAEVVVMLGEAVRGDLVEDLDTKSLTEIVSELPPDDAADMLAELPEEEADEILEQMEDEQADKIEELLEYGEDTAGGIMTPDVVAVYGWKSVADAVEYVRAATQEEDLHEIYIVDEADHLVGTVPLRRLVTTGPHTTLDDIVERDPVMVLAGDDQETVVQIIRKYDVISAAVVDAEGRLLGRITHDDLLDVAVEEAEEDLYRMAGTDPAEIETSSVFSAAVVRLKWLLPCMLGMLLTAAVLLIGEGHFDSALFGALAAFAPMIGATGGNSGIQTSTVIVRGFATGELAATKFSRAMSRHGRIALAMAPVCGLAAWVLASIGIRVLVRLDVTASHLESIRAVPLAIGLAMPIAILVAAVLGITLPFGFRRFGVDPAIASGPLVTTANDVVSVAIYMFLAMLIAG